jgi:phosphate uptake regulator
MTDKAVRKLQKIKGGSYMLSIPSEWVKTFGLRAGSELLVYENAETLKIRVPAKPVDKRTIELKDIEFTKYLVSVYYMQGVSEIIVRSKGVMNQDSKNELRNLQLFLTGLQLEDEGFDYIRYAVRVSEIKELGPEVSKFGSRTQLLLKDLSKTLLAPSREMAEDISVRCDELMKSYRLIVRTIALGSQRDFELNLNLPTKDLILYAVAVRDLGRMISHLKRASHALCNVATGSKELSQAVDSTAEMFEKSLKMFLDEELTHVQEIRKTQRYVEELCVACASTNQEFSELAKSIARIASYSIALMDDAVHKSVRV